MGFALLKHCKCFKESIMDCEKALTLIPNPPKWSLSEELAADTTKSRVAEAQFSQPLCTAIQIGLVDLLRTCGVRFRAVVGHSSGEIGAAYAAGLLTKRDAMGISYYRGCVTNLARGDAGQEGAMMAASMSFDAAAAICSEKQFKGRINVAASNSPSSVTLSGDKVAILEMKDILDERQVQARALQVDTAYHSHHMRACAEPYFLHLKELGVTAQTPPADQDCSWYSSVRSDTNILENPLEVGLEGQYWVDNLTHPVLFCEAVKLAVQSNTVGFTAAIEVGPHGALRGPVNQTLKQSTSTNHSMPYTSCLSRGKNAIETFSEALTTFWILAPSSVKLVGCRAAFGLVGTEPPLKDLPPYAWDHTQTHWRESRVGRNYRLNTRLPHDLLGRLWNDSGSDQTWRNTLRLNEMPWLKGHVFQNQILFPATGYISLAVDAAKVFAKDQSIKLVEVQDMTIPKALPIGEGDEVEILFTIRSRVSSESAAEKSNSNSVIEADFTCHSYPNNQLDAEKNCEGRLIIHLGVPEPTDLAPTSISDVELTPCNVNRFYHAASEIGFAYDGAFRALESLNKCWGHAKAVASWALEDPDMKIACTLHPAILDVAFQTGLSTVLSTAEKSMHSPYLPVGVKRVVIDPNQSFRTNVAIEAYLTSPTVGLGQRIEIDINIKSSSNQTKVCGIQLEGVTFKAIAEQQPSEDRNILAKTVWGNDASYGLLPAPSPALTDGVQVDSSSYTPEEYERVALFYLRSLSQSVSAQEMDALQPHYQKLIQSINAMTARIREDSDRVFLRAEWLNDSSGMITDLLKRDPSDVDMALLTSSATRTESLLQWSPSPKKNAFDSSVYQQTTWGSTCHRAIEQLVVKISHTFPRTNVLHLCGDAAETVSGILNALGDKYASYTCADASQDIVDELRNKISIAPERGRRLAFEVFDAEAWTRREHYDVVIVTDICRARQDLSESLRRLRSLMRPGGFLISMELTGRSLRPMAILGGSEEWWGNVGLGGEEPGIKTGEWDSLLSDNGFSGIDCIFHDQPKVSMHGYSVFCAQATDDRLDTLRSPLTSLRMIPPTPVVLIGGETSRVSKLLRQAKNLLCDWAPELQIWSRFDQINCSRIPPGCSVISLQDLDKPLFSSPPSVNELKNLKEVFGTAQNVLYVTSGRLVEDPYSNIMIGIGRSLRHEYIHLNLQFIDFDQGETWEIQTLITQFLRLIFSTCSSNITEGMLWVQESEIVVRNSQLLTPRVLLDSESNEIFNASRRRVVKSIGPTDLIVVDHEPDGASLEAILACSQSFETPKDHVRMEVKLSVALHVNHEAPCYLSYGKVKDDGGRTALALSNTDSSVVNIHKDFDFSAQIIPEYDAMTLVKLASLLIASNLVSRMPNSATTIVCGVSDGLATVISALAAEAGRKVMFIAITEKPQDGSNPGWIYLHPQIPARAARKLIPHDATTLFDLSRNGASVVSLRLPQSCTAHVFDFSSLSPQVLKETVNKYQTYQAILASVPMATILTLSDLSPKRVVGELKRLSLVTDWTRESSVNAIIRGLEPQALISPHKTYFLVGMASELGQSLAYFLVRSGARYIVLSSRNPKDSQYWLQDLRANGIDIRVIKMDVTDRSQVHETVRWLRQEMPEIGGVTNAALVLEPAVFANLSAASIAKQMMPKIHGTAHLDEVFKNDPLDFFMCFGSLGTVFGNPGHAIYHAGNAFMMSLVANRKRRGLAGSILNFGMLVDVGYVARADRSAGSNVEEWLRTDGLIALSEADFHHVILQGIATGHPRSPTCEVIMGVQTFYDKGQVPRPRWVETPFLSHMVRHVSEALRDDAPSSSHQSKLENASTVEEAIPPITELLSQKLKSMIHVSLDSIHPDEPLSRLGIDSINAIEIRKWLWKRLRVEISMVKILGRDPSVSIIRTIATLYLAKRSDSTPKGNIAVGKEISPKAKMRVNGKTQVSDKAKVNGNSAEATREVMLDDQNRSTTTSQSWSSPESEASSASSVESASPPIYTPKQEPRLEFSRYERLSIAQAGLFYIHKFSDTRTALNVTTRWRVDGPLDVERLSRAIKRTMNRHEALRTCFFATSDSSEVQQHVMNTKSFQLTFLQSTANSADVDKQKAFDRIKEHVYTIETGDTLRATLIRHTAQWHTLILGFHNLVIDVVSISIVLSGIADEYQSQTWSLYPTPTSYPDYTREQMEDIQSARWKDSIEYWINHLKPLPDVLPLLPVAKVRTRQNRRGYGHHVSDRELSSKFVQSIASTSQAHDVTPMQFYLAAMQVFLCRLLNIDDLVIGVTYNGRDPISKFRATVGHMASIMPIRFEGALDKTFPEVMKNTRTTLLSSLDHANIPFALIVDKVQPRVGEGNMPLIQVAFDYTADDSFSSTLGECTIAMEGADFTTVYDFVLNVRRSASGGHVLSIKCTDDYYSLAATQFITETFVGILHSLIQEPLTTVKDCRLFSDTQLDQARTVARTPAILHSWPDSLSVRFSQVAAEFPNSVAVKDGSESITYSQLREKVELYARILLDADATNGTRIAVFCKPSIDLYAIMLAVFCIGAIFVPLDISVPATRRNDMMKACKPLVLVFHASTATDVAENHLDTSSVLLNITQLAQTHQQDAPMPKQAPSELGSDSHILFTSGSTGVPKGIRLHQRGMMNYAAVSSKRYGFGQIRVLQQTSIGFDISFLQIYSALTNGGMLVVTPFESRGDPDMLSRLILDEKIQFTMCTPSEYSLLLAFAPDRLRQCTDWRFAGVGGEALPERLVDGLRKLKLPHLMLTNWYGPTEATIGTSRDIPIHDGAITSHDQSKDQIGSYIGHVFPNSSIYITSEDDGGLLPVGMPGEICVTGIMVNNGYLDAAMNEGRFVKNPFATPQDVEQGFTTMYKTGDRGLVHIDGSITFLGRTKCGSTLIKLRGLRIDLNEVTGAILKAAPDDFADTVVTVRGDPQYLVCHVVFKPGRHQEQKQLMCLLQSLPLPSYMIPATIVVLDRLPLGPNGKLDLGLLQGLPLPIALGQTETRSLLTQENGGQQNGEIETLTRTEETLRAVWIDVLGVVADTIAYIGLHSSFQAIGGNSFLLVHLQHAINSKMGVRVPLFLLWQAEDLKDMARLIEVKKGEK
jgi:amino acid adenylation domain-containing protein